MKNKASRILVIASREIVAAKACYQRTCYNGYTRTVRQATMGLPMAVVNHTSSEFLEDEYAHLESETNRQMHFDRMSLKTRK